MNGKNQDMGSRDRSAFVLYRCNGTFNPSSAVKTGFSQTDFDVMMDVLPRMYSFGQSGQSAVGGIRTVEKIFVFEHSTPRGEAQPQKLFDLVQVKRKNQNEHPRCFQDYVVTVGTPPPGVKIIEIDP
jgi:CRISPR-associated protein Csd2